MGKHDRNAPLPADAATASEFFAAVQNVADVMTKARRMGLECSFSGIRPNEAGQFRVHDLVVKKVIADGNSPQPFARPEPDAPPQGDRT